MADRFAIMLALINGLTAEIAELEDWPLDEADTREFQIAAGHLAIVVDRRMLAVLERHE